MSHSDVIFTLALLVGCSEAYLSSLCCGDNFCCSIATSGSASCWGGNKFSPPSTTVKALTCGGKAVLGVDAAMRIVYYEGDSGYGPDSAGASSLVGLEVKDVDLSFWGGALIKPDGSLQTWSQDPVYCSSSTSISCQPTNVNPTQVAFAFSSVPTGAAYTAISCGGKRGGHFCCVIPSTGTGLECFGDSRGTYTPTSTHLSGINFAVHQVSAGVDFIVVLSTTGKLGVYGHVTNGEITKATSGITNRKPTTIATLPQNSLDTGSEVYVQVSSCNFGVYALKQDGSLHAWGRIMTSCGVCGADVPVDFAGYPDGLTWGMLSGGNVGGYAHTCALSTSNVVTCWGSDYAGQVTREKPTAAMKADFIYPNILGSSSPSPVPAPVPASAAVTITGTIYCDNDFEFYFNGQLVKSDPIDFTPHQAVRVSFTYDGTSAKTYAILCQDYASASGYEYTSTNSPQLGDGALIAEFSDGTVTSSNWKSFVATHGPTAASESAGCSASNLGACVVEDYGTPSNWFSTSFDDSSWSAATQYTVQQAGWGRTPTWSSTSGCCQPTSPMTRSNLGCCNCNSDGTASGFTSVTVTESECLNPATELGSSSASFLWGPSLTKDNKMLFRYTVAAPSSSSPTPTPAPTPSPVSSSSSSYLKITSGSCADAGGAPITTAEACNTAASALGLSDTVAQESGAAGRPEGCYQHSSGNLYLATNAANVGASATSDHHPVCAMSGTPSPSPSPASSGSPPSPVPTPVPTSGVQPNIYLSDPIDTVDSIHSAYCFDIFGMPGSNTCDNKAIEARSCRAAGEDTQFEYDSASSAIKATNYNSYCSGGLGPCLTVDGTIAAGASLVMAACTGDAKQVIAYSATTCRFMLGGFCLQVGPTSTMQTGLKRTMSLADCASVDAARSEWTVVPATGSWTTCSPAAIPSPSAAPAPASNPSPTPSPAPASIADPSPSPSAVLAPTPNPSPGNTGPAPLADAANKRVGLPQMVVLMITMCILSFPPLY